MRSASMYVSHGSSPTTLRHQQSYPRPQYSKYQEQSYREQQQKQYEEYEQQSRYYREGNGQPSGVQDLQQSRTEPYVMPYRHSTHQGAYADAPLARSPPTPRRHHTQQLQPQRSLNLGPMPSNRFAIARDQLPTAPSPSVFSATQPAPVFPEPTTTTLQATTVSSGATVDASKSAELPATTNITAAVTQTADNYVARHPNRNSGYSDYSLGSSATTERIARPLSAIQEPTARFPISPVMNGHHSASTLTRSGSDPHWGSASSALMAQAKARAAQNHGYSRQVTLSSIPANEEVPPMPGKMTSKTGKVRLQLTFDRPFFNAGGELSGRLEIQCSSSRSIMLADMIIELLGYEALTKDHLAPKIFHKTVLRLQDMRHPSQAVQENIDPDSEGYWMARKGRTIFPFRLNIQDTLPNSYDSKLGQVRYVASAIALMKANHHKEIVNHTREVFIYETWTTDDIVQARKKSVKADTSKRLFMGGEGSLEMYAELTRTMVSSGGIVYVNVGVKNLTKKKIMGIKLSLWRHIAASNMRLGINSHSSTLGNRDQDNVKNYSEIIYKGEDFAFDNDDPRMVALPVYIPSGVYSLRNTNYLHVQFFVQVSLMASMSKALAVELPIYVTHASSWSDPPPRIPRDFAFPVHEDDPVKKNKTGVFSKKKTGAAPSQVNGSTAGPKKTLGTNDSSSTVATSSSTTVSKSGTSILSETNGKDGSSSRPVPRRSLSKHPDSPTSVLEFSQAGNLFVVNPDSSSIHRGSDAAFPRAPFGSQPALSPPAASHTSTNTSTSSSPPDRSTLMMNADQTSPTIEEEKASKSDSKLGLISPAQAAEYEKDFDMNRSLGTPLASSAKTEHEKSKPSKMGLRKKLAKLSISIPNHSSSSTSLSKTPRVSPQSLPSTPRSTKSLLSESPEELTFGEFRSPCSARSLSRQSSGSSLGSFKHIFDNHSCKSSIGSTRVVTVSPGPVSPSPGILKMTKYSSSGSESPALSTNTSNNPSATPSGASTPTSQSGPSITEACDEQVVRFHETGRSMTPSIPDLRLHQGTPVMEEMGRESCFKPSEADSRSSTPSPSEAGLATDLSSPSTLSSFVKPWEGKHKFSTSSINSSTLDLYDAAQTARDVRDEYYFGQNAMSHIASAEPSETRLALPQTGDPRIGEEYIAGAQDGSTSIGMVSEFFSRHGTPPSQEAFYDEMTQHQTPDHVMSASSQMHQPELVLSIPGQQIWRSGQFKDVVNAEKIPVQPAYGRSLAPSPSSRPNTPSEQIKASCVHALTAGSALTPVQTPYQYSGADGYPLLYQEAPPSHEAQPLFSRNSPQLEGINDPNKFSTLRPGISLVQYDHRSCPATPHRTDMLSGNSSREDTRAYSMPEYNALLQVSTPSQHYHDARMPDQPPMQQEQRGTQFSPEIFSTPMLLQNESIMSQSSGGGVSTPQPITPLSSSNSLQSDYLRLTPNDVNVAQQLSTLGTRTLMEQSHSIAVPMASESPAETYQESRYDTRTPLGDYSPHPSGLNPQHTSRKLWHAETVPGRHRQQQLSVSGQGNSNSEYANQEYPQSAEGSPASCAIYEEVMNHVIPGMQHTSATPLQEHYLYEPRSPAAYQPYMQYKPRPCSPGDMLSSPAGTQVGMKPSGSNILGINFQPAMDMTPDSGTQLPVEHPPGSGTTQSPLLPASVVEPLMTHIEISTPVFYQENPYFGSDDGLPPAAPLFAEDALMSSSLGVDQETAQDNPHAAQDELQQHQQPQQDQQQQQLSSNELLNKESFSNDAPDTSQTVQPMLSSPALARVNTTFRTSPLAFEGNVVTAGSSSPPFLETAKCITPGTERAQAEVLD
ncbi:hypothetical protein EDD11_005440 [Mortierella claussenii]|nr:hypothetical protein EDD11_005440 [Mortierella claussenii]